MSRILGWARRFGLARAVCIVLLFALVPLRLANPRPLEELRVRTFDLFQVLRPRAQTTHPVVIVDIDEDSLKAIGQWPWPRTTIADLVTRITQLGALTIGFDVIFAEPDRMSPAIAEQSFRGIDADTRAKLDSLPSNDQVLADAIKQSRVVVGQAGTAIPTPKSPAEAALQTGFAVRGPDPSPYLVTFPGLLRNVLPIEEAAAGRGLFSINPESDGIVRRVPVIMQAQGALVPSLTMEMLRVVSHSSAILVRVNDAGVQSVAVPGLEVPTDRNGQFWVHFNRHDQARFVSAKDVLQGNGLPDRFRGRLVLIGTSAIGLLDLKTTPVEAAMPGVEVHAEILESVLTKSLLVQPNYAIGAELVLAVLLGLVIIAAAPMLSATVVVLLGAALIAGLVGLSLYLFVEHNLLRRRLAEQARERPELAQVVEHLGYVLAHEIHLVELLEGGHAETRRLQDALDPRAIGERILAWIFRSRPLHRRQMGGCSAHRYRAPGIFLGLAPAHEDQPARGLQGTLQVLEGHDRVGEEHHTEAREDQVKHRGFERIDRCVAHREGGVG